MNSPVYIDWAIAGRCNLSCRHCLRDDGAELTADEAKRTAREIIALTPRWVILEGGEPLLRPDLAEIGKLFRRAGIDVFVITNGNTFTEAGLRELASFSPKVLFSIDGATAEVYEYVKRGARFETALRWVGRCAEAGLFHGVTTVLTRLTAPQAGDIIRLTEGLGGQSVVFLPLKPFAAGGEAAAYYADNALSPGEQEAAIADIYGLPRRIEVFYDEPFLWNLAARHGFDVGGTGAGITIPETRGCAASLSLYIRSDGGVRPCMFCPPSLTFGNVKADSLEDIWRRIQESPALAGWAHQATRKGNCAACAQFETCRGCLARTTMLLGDPMASDPCCPLAA